MPPLGAEWVADPADLGGKRLDSRLALVHAAAEGRSDAPRLNHVVFECHVVPRPEPVLEALARTYQLTERELQRSPCVLVGTVDEVVELLVERRERWGFSFVTVPWTALETFAPVVGKLAGC